MEGFQFRVSGFLSRRGSGCRPVSVGISCFLFPVFTEVVGQRPTTARAYGILEVVGQETNMKRFPVSCFRFQVSSFLLISSIHSGT
jgi:hypothetical protein